MITRHKHIHILGICGTFMGGIAAIAKQAGYRVTGCDANVYPPMSTQLEGQGIELIEGFGIGQLDLNPDVFIIGIRLAAPVMVALLLTTIALGIMARAFPQMNIFMISMPLNIGLGLVIITLTLLLKKLLNLPAYFRIG